MVRDIYSTNTYNIHYTANDSIVNSAAVYGSQVFIPNTVNEVTGAVIRHKDTINAVAHSGLGIVSGSIMEGMALVSPYK
jgi:hypothetical protein